MIESRGGRRHVPMDALWTMPVEVPTSLLLQDGNYLWTCGQISLDADGRVLHPDDLAAQSVQVCGYISEILGRLDLAVETTRRALLYYVHRSDAARAEMLQTFRHHLGPAALLDLVEVPHFYYPGLMLEVDIFGGIDGPPLRQDQAPVQITGSGDLTWVSFGSTSESLTRDLQVLDTMLADHGLDRDRCLSEHWFVPTSAVTDGGDRLLAAGWTCDGFVVDVGPATRVISGVLTFIESRSERRSRARWEAGPVVVTTRAAEDFVWLHGRSTDPDADLVGQTRSIMRAFGDELDRLDLGFDDVSKCTTHYVGGPTPEDLHGNMTIRNDHYRKPGLASTGLPVFGFSDRRSKIAIDLTVRSPTRAASAP